ncbi:hypothetical protein QO002_004366 [Pararhizobium capsulatum DSM 1112]|uniref:Uncharacterized protein n=1 Tax=Pararhizobium capsulatum DSM 1112 TaxID=1121113 RepID=A0ABU0BXK6_9HYPH|nr:hypothetical protein [Pararhizobium capsulatum]MDQ0322160.1 hypothetical protein [Pararhizobium capsulatum DSM 1112]
MIDFTKPLLADEVPEPPIVEQKMKEDAQQRARASLAGIQGAAKAAETAGLIGKPAPPVKQLQKIKVEGPKAVVAVKKKPAPVRAKVEVKEAKKKNPAKKPPKPAKPEASAPPAPDHDWQLRQSALQTVLAGMHAQPDADAISSLFALFVKAPDKEVMAAALVLSMTFLRSPAKARGPLMKSLGPAMQTFRGSKLAVLLAVRLGHVVTPKAPAPVAPPPGG